MGTLFAVFMLGVASAQGAERWLGATDHPAIVIDEIVGMAVALLGLPLQAGTAIAAFALFRALDILKPWPVKAFERLPGGWGVMGDDLVAGSLTNVFLQGVRIVWSEDSPLIDAFAAPM
jgi:phosphatidylglycerophosphatase A